MNWYIGAAGGCGTYTIDDDLLHAALVNDMDQKDMVIDFHISVENEKAVLEMEYQDETTIYKLADGTYMDRMERHFTYNGVDIWIDENGVEWNEAAKD